MKCSACLALLIFATNGLAVDVPFGTNSLPFLSRASESVVRLQGATKVERASKAGGDIVVYTATISEVLRGKPSAAKVVLVVPKSLDVEDAKQLNNAVVFLSPRLSEEQIQKWQIAEPAPAYQIVGGKSGAVPADEKQRQAATTTFINLSPDQKLEWAKVNSENPDAFIARSSILELGYQSKSSSANADKAIGALSKILNSEKVNPSSKLTAIESLQMSNSQKAVPLLKDFSMNPSNPKQLRSFACNTMASLPGGINALKDMESINDDWLSPRIRDVLKKASPSNQLRRPDKDQLDKFKVEIRSGKSGDKRQALNALGGFEYSGEIQATVEDFLVNGKESLMDKLEIVEKLQSLNNSAAAATLKKVVLDSTQPNQLRDAALMAIGRMESGVSAPTINQISSELPNGNLKSFAKVLLGD